MGELAGKLRRLKYKLKHNFFAIENIVLIVAVVMCLVWTYQSIAAMSRNWELTEKLNAERKELQLLEIEVETAELENEYLQSEEYQELAARRLLDKVLPGEKMVVMPDNSELARNKHKTIEVVTNLETKEYSNFDRWLQYLFPKS